MVGLLDSTRGRRGVVQPLVSAQAARDSWYRSHIRSPSGLWTRSFASSCANKYGHLELARQETGAFVYPGVLVHLAPVERRFGWCPFLGGSRPAPRARAGSFKTRAPPSPAEKFLVSWKLSAAISPKRSQEPAVLSCRRGRGRCLPRRPLSESARTTRMAAISQPIPA